MQTLNYWKQFENTGKIEDYLFYKNDDQGGGSHMAQPTSRYHEEAIKQSGVNSNAGIHKCNRNDFETGAYRGI